MGQAASQRAPQGDGHGGCRPRTGLSTFDNDKLTRGLKGELADVATVPEERLQLVHDERGGRSVLYAVYRDVETGKEHAVEVGRDDVTFSVIED